MSPTEAKESTKREIAVEVPADEVSRQTDALVQKYQKLARIPGFRKGHVPPSIIRQRFAEDIKTEVVEALVPRYFRQEAQKQGLTPVSQPRVTDLHIHDGEPLKFKASFEVLPEIRVEGYKELRAEKPEVAVCDAEVDEALGSLREQHARFRRSKDERWRMATLRKFRSTASRSRVKDNLSIWMKCWSRLPGSRPCPSSQKI